ncbi:MAG: glucose-1-phosphate adenylyltransferase [Selenomonadaceae bacterium]|nr:glucose-1-phosphate adenylyltransferase [Selenomonadaceae bacterium]
MKKECVAMLLAGGQGSRLYALTSHVAKPAVPFGGKFRIIDFPLSNCVNSGIDTVGVLTQYRPLELNSYIGSGQPWDLDRADGGVHILPPYMREGEQGTWYKGTANAIYQNIDFLDRYDPDYVVVLSGDHIYKMDYSKMLSHHKSVGAACTISVLEVSMEEAKRFGIMNVDERDIVYEFEEKPEQPKSNLASMGVYTFTWAKLRQYLIADEADPASSNDFGKNIIPAMLGAGETLAAYRFKGYWKDVGTIDSLWDANMDMLSPHGSIDLYDPSWPIYARAPIQAPHITGSDAVISHSVVTGGCRVFGTVENSVLFRSVTVEAGAEVRYSILMPGTVVRAGARVEYAILAENSVVEENARVGAPPDVTVPNWGVAVVASGVTVGKNAVVAPNGMIRQDVKEGEQA